MPMDMDMVMVLINCYVRVGGVPKWKWYHESAGADSRTLHFEVLVPEYNKDQPLNFPGEDSEQGRQTRNCKTLPAQFCNLSDQTCCDVISGVYYSYDVNRCFRNIGCKTLPRHSDGAMQAAMPGSRVDLADVHVLMFGATHPRTSWCHSN